MTKKLLSWVLALAMVCSMLPVNALAALADAGLDKPIIQTESVTMINPLYADVVTLEDLVQPSGQATIDPNAVSEDAYADTYEEAAAQLREGMKLRQETIEVYYRTENYDFSTDAPAIWDGSFTHTGVPTEGDYLKWVWAGCSYSGSGYVSGNMYYMTYTFTLTYHSTAEQEAELDVAVEDLLTELNPTGTDYQKLKTVYDYICANITYDYDSEGTLKHTAYAALVNKTAVCQGYAVLLYRLALEMGIDNRMVSGTGNGGGHAWNIVKLNDVYYNVDSTWDATWMQKVGYYNYFLQCEDTFTEGGTDHIRDEEYDTAEFHAAYPMSETDFDPETDDMVSSDVASGTCGENLTWVLTNDGTLTISGEGAMYDYNHYGESGNQTPWYNYSELIKATVVEEGVTYLGRAAFNNCQNMSGISLPSTLESIGEMAFLACISLPELVVPEGVTQIGEGAFYWLGASRVVLPSTLKAIAPYAFWGTSNLAVLELSEGLEVIGESAFVGSALPSITIPASVTSIGNAAFDACQNLTDITFCGNPPAFDENAFGNLTATAYYPAGNETWTEEVMQQYGGTITWEAYVAEIASGSCGENLNWVLTSDGTLTISGEGAINDYDGSNRPWQDYMSKITSIVVEEGITGTGAYAFWMTNAESISLPDTLTSIGDYSICWNPNLTQITIPESVTEIGVFGLAQNFSLTALNIPASVTSIAGGAFWGNIELTTLTVAQGNANYRAENGVLYCIISGTDASGTMKYNDTALHTYIPGNTATEFVIPDTVQQIAPYAFFNENLTKVTIPACVSEIGSAAFCNTSVTELVFQGSVPTIAEDSLKGITATVYYPAGNITWTDEAIQNYGGTLTLTACGNADLVAYGTCGTDTTWELTSDEVLTISGYGVMDSYTGAMIAPWSLYYEQFEAIVMEEGVTDIGAFSFAWLGNVKSVSLPNTLRTIGTAAFWGVGMNVDDGLSVLRIPAGVSEISGSAFSGCENLAEVWFEGDAPATDEVLFGNAITVYYPAGNDTWTEEAKATICADGASWNAWGDADLVAYGSCGENVAWTLTTDGELTVSGEGAMYDYDFFNGVTAPWLCYYTRVDTLILEPGITHVGQDAFFFGFSGSTTSKIVLNEGLKSIGARGFCGSAYLTEVTLPASLEMIGYQAFQLCPELAVITFLGDAPVFGEDLFDSGREITAYYPANNATWTPDVMQDYGGTITWEAYAAEIASGACGENLTWVLTSDGTLTISGEGEMYDYDYDGGPWYDYSDQITSVVIEDGVTSIGSYAFIDGAFSQIDIANTVESIGSYAFHSCNGLTEVVLPSSLTEIREGTFFYCEGLVTVGIPDSVTTIGHSAFFRCYNLADVVIPQNVFVIGQSAFYRCYGITKITIPDSVTTIGSGAFFYCTGLTDVTFEGNAPTIQLSGDIVSDDVFDGVTATVYYPVDNETWTEEVMQDYGGTITWVPYGDEEAITITSQPVDYVGLVGDMTTFTVIAEGENLTYQWYFSKDDGNTWEASSSKTNSITVEFKAYRLGYMYRCEITDSEGNTVTSDPATLRAEEIELVITTQPVSYVGAVNDEVTFVVEATGNGVIYEWFFSDNGGETWAKSYSPGYQTNTLAPILRSHRDGNMYKCIVTDVFGNSVESETVSMSVKADDIVITSQPQSVENGVLSQLYTFTVEAAGENLTYRWEYSDDGGETWQESWNQGYNTATLSVRLNANRDGNQYRCVITSGQKIVRISDPAVLDLQNPSAEIISQSGNVSVVANKTATFTVEAEGMDLTYLWYRSNDKGATWSQTYLTGYNTNTLSFAANANRAAMYMCKVTDGSGTSVWSQPVKLQILSAELKILTQPVSITCASGETAVFIVEAQGDTLTYQWYASSDGGATWTASYLTGYNTAEFSFAVNTSRAARLYKCVITDIGGNTVETDAVSVTIG